MNTHKCISDSDIGRMLTGDITEQQRTILFEHIRGCPNCKARWQQASSGAEYMNNLLSKAWSNARKDVCLSDEVVNGFVNDSLSEDDTQRVRDHLDQCQTCSDRLAERYAAAYDRHGDKWWSEYVARQILVLLSQIPEQIGSLLAVLKTAKEEPTPSPQIIKLTIFEPSESDVGRIAAATGEGLSEQLLHQDDPPFDLHLVKFGRQLRIGVRAVGEDSPYKNCLGRLELSMADTSQHSQVILVDKGEGQCVLDQADISVRRLQKGRPGVRFVPIVTLAELASEGSEAYRPIFVKLLVDKDPQIRKSVIGVVTRIYGPGASSLVKPLANDDDKSVRLAVQKALRQFPER